MEVRGDLSQYIISQLFQWYSLYNHDQRECNIPVYFGITFSVCKIFMCYIHAIYIVKRAPSLFPSHPRLPPSFHPSFLPSLVSAVKRSIRIQSLFYYLFKIISSLRTLLKHAYCYLNRLLISRLQLHILSSSSEDSMNLQIADVV